MSQVKEKKPKSPILADPWFLATAAVLVLNGAVCVTPLEGQRVLDRGKAALDRSAENLAAASLEGDGVVRRVLV
jgi:hypothetical protein